MTDHEAKCARALENVSFVPSIPQKLFVREMNLLADRESRRQLTDRQSSWLSALVWKYRRQIRDRALVFECGVWVGAAKPPIHIEPTAGRPAAATEGA